MSFKVAVQWLLKEGLLKGLLIAFVFSVPVHAANAPDYNNGFVAAESGDYKSALQQWGPLAEKGHALAQFNLALLYHGGLGVNVNEAQALEWYKKSAKNGYYKAQEYLAVGYREGWFGLPKDAKKADYWEQEIEKNSQ